MIGALKYRFLILSIVLVGITKTSYAQQYPVFTQYYFNELVINPAYAGNHIQLSLTGIYRNQWINLPGAPKTFSISGHSSFLKKKMGLGILINHDEIGSYKNDHIFASYAYRLQFPKATLSMGIQAGVNLLGAHYDLDLQHPTGDPSFESNLNSLKPNFGAGVFYSKKRFFVGVSVPFILNNRVANSVQGLMNGIQEARYYYLRSGLVHPLDRNEKVKVNPSILLRAQEGQPLSIDLNLGFVFYDVFGVGVSRRSNDSFITFIDLQLSEQMHFAYSYDWTSSAINAFSSGTHEFVLNYRFKISSVHKNLECPRYYDYR